MTGENIDSPNAIKYSIWNTRTDEHRPVIKDKFTKSIDKPPLDSKQQRI
jgi:hypothetical protein